MKPVDASRGWAVDRALGALYAATRDGIPRRGQPDDGRSRAGPRIGTPFAVLPGMDTLVILNPNAGSADEVPHLEGLLEEIPGVEVCATERPGHARELAEKAIVDGCRTVVSAGGDGTLNEVLNGLARDFSAVRLGVLPLGTGNDFVRSIFVPDDVEKALDVLRRGDSRKVDVGRCTWSRSDGSEEVRHFLNMSVGGFAVAINEVMDEGVKKFWGPLSYARSAAGALSELEAFRSTLHLHGGEDLEMNLYLLVVANARFVASGIPAAPQAEPDDGCFDIIAFPEMPLAQIAALIPPTLRGEHMEHELVTVRRTRSLRVVSEPKMEFNVDGEQCASTPVTFEILPQVLEVLVGEPEDRPEQLEDEAKG